MSEDSQEELAECLDTTGVPEPVEQSRVGDESDCEDSLAHDTQVVAAVAAEIECLPDTVGLGADVAPSGPQASASSAAASSSEAPVPAPLPEAIQPWDRLTPISRLGYYYDETGRSVMRVQRGAPARSITVNCYRHPSCRLLLMERACTDDEGLKRWLYEVPSAPSGAPTAQRQELAKQHMALGKARWMKGAGQK